ncbi:hypothetical protein BKA69DRAFT_1170836 [Paraphysoderma sedebokerense]|nr:hypothetical protein BKA69DRAFT_1170836 [Paraphysoderma sedebokerense]
MRWVCEIDRFNFLISSAHPSIYTLHTERMQLYQTGMKRLADNFREVMKCAQLYGTEIVKTVTKAEKVIQDSGRESELRKLLKRSKPLPSTSSKKARLMPVGRKTLSIDQSIQQWKSAFSNGLHTIELITDPVTKRVVGAHVKIEEVLRCMIYIEENNNEGKAAYVPYKVIDLIVYSPELERPPSPSSSSTSDIYSKITLHGMALMAHLRRHRPETELFDILTWLSSYSNFFTAPCIRCDKIINFDPRSFNLTPPTDRCLRETDICTNGNMPLQFEIVHDSCK